jgi:hypothetical protein
LPSQAANPRPRPRPLPEMEEPERLLGDVWREYCKKFTGHSRSTRDTLVRLGVLLEGLMDMPWELITLEDLEKEVLEKSSGAAHSVHHLRQLMNPNFYPRLPFKKKVAERPGRHEGRYHELEEKVAELQTEVGRLKGRLKAEAGLREAEETGRPWWREVLPVRPEELLQLLGAGPA